MENNENLTTCPTCGKQVAKTAKTCPHCGANLAKPDVAQIFIAIGLALLALMWAMQSGANLVDAFYG